MIKLFFSTIFCVTNAEFDIAYEVKISNWNTGRLYFGDRYSFGISSFGPVCQGQGLYFSVVFFYKFFLHLFLYIWKDRKKNPKISKYFIRSFLYRSFLTWNFFPSNFMRTFFCVKPWVGTGDESISGTNGDQFGNDAVFLECENFSPYWWL